jgi:hypothetical protein
MTGVSTLTICSMYGRRRGVLELKLRGSLESWSGDFEEVDRGVKGQGLEGGR